MPAMAIVGLALASAWAVDATAQSAADDPLAFRQAMLAAEDSRAADPADLATLLAGVGSPDDEIRRIALRALGRLERADLSERIAASLDADAPAVRAEAANALPRVMLKIADAAERRVDRRMDLLLRLMEPILLLGVAGMVVFIFAALVLPMMRMSSTIG